MKVSLVSNSSFSVILGSSKGVVFKIWVQRGLQDERLDKPSYGQGVGFDTFLPTLTMPTLTRHSSGAKGLSDLFDDNGHATVRAKPTHYMPTTSRHVVGAKRLDNPVVLARDMARPTLCSPRLNLPN